MTIHTESTAHGFMATHVTANTINVTLTKATHLEVLANISADLVHINSDCCWWISQTLVINEHDRGRGIGSFILHRLLTEVSHTSFPRAHVSPGGYGAQHNRLVNFYHRNGFKSVLGEPDLLSWQASDDHTTARP